MSNREEYIRKMQAKLEEWNTEISTLNAKASGVKSDVKNEYYEQIESLKAKQATARQTIEELQQAGESAWADLKLGIGLSWSAMGEAFDSAKSRFK
jgi:outer membrane murein-binding lipoprotein Lpp